MNYLPGVFAARILLVYSLGMSVPLMLIGLLEREPSHGYDLKRDFVVTHDARVAAYADREIVVGDGKVRTLTGARG